MLTCSKKKGPRKIQKLRSWCGKKKEQKCACEPTRDSFGASKGWQYEDQCHSVQDTTYFDTTYIKAKFLYQCKKKQNHFPDAALHSWGWSWGLHFCRHTDKQQVPAEIVAHSPCCHDLLCSSLDSIARQKCPLQPHCSILPGMWDCCITAQANSWTSRF